MSKKPVKKSAAKPMAAPTLKGRTVLLASGASGGHIFPALAVADALRKQGMTCVFVLGGPKFAELIQREGYAIERLPASAFNVRNPIRKAMAMARFGWGIVRAFRLMQKHKPAVVFGNGGYATVATILAAKALGVSTVIHDSNVLPGRANRLLARLVDRILLTFEQSAVYFADAGVPMVVTGAPLRKEVLAAAGKARPKGKEFCLFVVGGSQGSRTMNDVVPDMVALMKPEERARVRVIHQARPEDVARVNAAYGKLGLAGYDVAAFFNDMPQRYVQAHVVIGRSGAGTLTEVALIGRAAIYVPLHLADNHQMLNAQVAEEAGAAVVLQPEYFTPANLLVHVRGLMRDASRLEAMEEAARGISQPDATANVAREVASAALSDVMHGCC